MLYLPVVLAYGFEYFGNFVCSIDGIDAAISSHSSRDEWNQTEPVVMNIQGQDRAVRIDSKFEYKWFEVEIVLHVDFWVGNADGSDMQKWNYMKFDSEKVEAGWGINSSQDNVEETADAPGLYKCRNVVYTQ